MKQSEGRRSRRLEERGEPIERYIFLDACHRRSAPTQSRLAAKLIADPGSGQAIGAWTVESLLSPNPSTNSKENSPASIEANSIAFGYSPTLERGSMSATDAS